MRNNLTKVVTTPSHRAGLNFETLFSSNCCKQEVPIRARVSFSRSRISMWVKDKISIYLDICTHKVDPKDHPGNAPEYQNKMYKGR